MAMATLLAIPSAAAEPSVAVIDAVQQCRTIVDTTARLACFDAATATLADAIGKHDVVILDRDRVQQTKRSLFGFVLPALPFFSSGPDKAGIDKDRIEAVDLTIKDARLINNVEWRMVMDDGSVWTTTEPLASKPPASGAIAHIKRGIIGNYFVKIGNGDLTRVRRER
jgi:hypothetical protein